MLSMDKMLSKPLLNILLHRMNGNSHFTLALKHSGEVSYTCIIWEKLEGQMEA